MKDVDRLLWIGVAGALVTLSALSIAPIGKKGLAQAIAGPDAAVGTLVLGQDEEEKCLDQRLMLRLFDPIVGRYEPEEDRQTLTLSDFFDTGWTTGWEEPEEGPDDAPRFRLLRIQRAFWERELRFAFSQTVGAEGGLVDEQEGEFELELPISRRFLIEFEWPIIGLDPIEVPYKSGGGDLEIIPEVMLFESHDVSFSSGLVVRTPTGSKRLESGRTTVTPYLALWKDLGRRIGLHTYLGMEVPLDGRDPGQPDAVLQYGVAPTKTLTPKETPLFGNLTAFIEINGETDLGNRRGSTTLTFLPGLRWLLFKDFWLAAGYEFPVTGTEALESRIWGSIYRDF